MNSNIPNSSSQINKISPISSGINQSKDRAIVTNPHPNISPVSQVSIFKTEEQKEIVRTNVFEPNNTSSDNGQKFCVVTEVIKRKSNISFDPKTNAPNKVNIRFSFNKPIESSLNQNFQNKTLNINIVGSRASSDKEKNAETYKLLIKRIASQLKNKIRPPTQGFFYFALQKGDYRELVKKIAFLLKKNMQNKMFWENERFKNESIQVKVINKNTSDNANVNNANAKMNSHDHNANNANKKNNNTNIKSNLQNKKQINGKNSQINQNNNNNQRKVKSHITKTNINNNNKNSLSNPTAIKNNFGSHRLNNVVNPFNAIKTNNHQKNEDARSASSETNKTGKIKFTNNPKIPIMENKEENNLKEDAKNNSEKTQVIKISKKTVNNATFNIQNTLNSDNDIEMKDETNIINQEIQNGTNVDSVTNNMKTIPHRNTATIMTNNTDLNNPSIISENNLQKITFNSNKSPGKKLHIKFSPMKKTEEIINEIKKNSSKKTSSTHKKQIKININEIIMK